MQSWPDAVPFNPQIGADSPVLEALVRGPSAALSAVLLVVGDRARQTGFGQQAAIAIANAWNRAERTPVLVDLALEDPGLHTLLGVSNEEGVADAIAFGTSLRLLWQPVAAHQFSFLPSGYAPDPEEVLASGDWRRIIAQEAATGHTLLLYVPAHAPGLETLAGKVGAVIVIGEEADLPSAADSMPRPYAIVAVLTPEAPAADVGVYTEAPRADEVQPIAEQPVTMLSLAAVVGGGVVPTDEEFEASPEAPGEIAASEDVRPARYSPPLIADDVTEVARAEAERTAPPPKAPEVPEAPEAPDLERVSDADFDRIRVPREGSGREALIADLRARQRAAMMAPPADAEPLGGWPGRAAAAATARGATIDGIDRRSDEAVAAAPAGMVVREDPPATHARVPRALVPTGTLPGEPPHMRQGEMVPGRRKRNPWLLPLLVAAVAFVTVGAVYYLQWRATQAAARESVQPRITTAIPPVDSLAMVPLPYVVAIEAHTQLATAEARLATLVSTHPRMDFFVAPLIRANVPYYHVFAGPLRDSATAVVTLDTLLAREVKTGAAREDVRQMPLSFLIDEYSMQGDARKRVEDLRRTGVPTFAVHGAVNGQTVWRVYGGAYAGLAEADVMRQLLKGAGVRDSLVTRTGRSNQ